MLENTFICSSLFSFPTSKFVNPLCLPAIGQTGFGTSAYGGGGGNHSVLDTTGLDIVGKNAIVLGQWFQ